MFGFNKRQSSLREKEELDNYKKGRSVHEFLDFVDYDPKTKLFLSRDGISAGALLDIQPIGCEGRSDDILHTISDEISNILMVIPEEINPYVVQVFAYDEFGLSDLKNRMESYLNKGDKLDNEFKRMMHEHIDIIGDPKGVFVDPNTDKPWSGRVRKIKLCIYQKLKNKGNKKPLSESAEELMDVVENLMERLENIRVKPKQVGMKEMYEWMLPFLNDTSNYPEGHVGLLEAYPYPGDTNLSYGTDLPRMLFLERPESIAQEGVWRMGNTYTKALALNAYRRAPEVGQLSAERVYGESEYALLDKLPTGSMINFTIVYQISNVTKTKLQTLGSVTNCTEPEAYSANLQSLAALDLIAGGDKVYPTTMTVYVKGNSIKEVNKKGRDVSGLLSMNGLSIFDPKTDLMPLTTFVRSLPFGYSHFREKTESKCRLLYLSQISNLIPIYGRSRGSGKANALFFNRGGEDVTFDMLKDKTANAFGGILGPPGSGKSALLVYLAQSWIVGYNPRVFILEKGNSFGLLAQYLEKNDKTINSVSLNPSSGFGLMPFANAITMIEEREQEELAKGSTGKRDHIGEMEMLTRMMITEGLKTEEDLLRSHHKTLIRKAINCCAQEKYEEIKAGNIANSSLVRPCDIVKSFIKLANTLETKEERSKLKEMARSLEKYTSGMEGDLFNGDSGRLPEVDFTLIDFGALSSDGYEGSLVLSFMCIMQEITAIAERDQYSGRPIIVIVDEAHLILKNESLAPYLIKMLKMFRKLNTWPWLATQNLDDWSGQSKKMLNMFEWFIAMSPPPDEIEQLRKYRNLTKEEIHLMNQCRKEKGKFTEGVLLSANLKPLLFRNVPPSLSLALAMTEGDEKAQRKKLMEKHKITELEAVYMISDIITKNRRINSDK